MNAKYTARDEKGNIYEFESKVEGSVTYLTLKKSQFENVETLYLLEELGKARAGDEGYYILPRNAQRNGEIQTFFKAREDAEYLHTVQTMSWYGIKKKEACYLVRIERNYHYYTYMAVKNGEYVICPVFHFVKENDLGARTDKVYDDIRIEIVSLPEHADYNDMARAERNIRLQRGEIIPLREKCKREAVEYARKYPLVRIRMGWKPSPSPVKHQTLENEPQMHVACTFKRVREFADELKKAGVEGVELQLVGWNISGHDGRWPQLFPADPRLGGNEEFRRTIEYVKSLGYRISTHTNNLDSYEIGNTFNFEDVIVQRNGTLLELGDFSGGHSYRVCLSRQLKNAKRDLPELCSYGENGLHFTDVVSIVLPDVCYSKDHPVNTASGIIYAQSLMDYTRTLFGGFSSEGAMDFSIGHIDYALYLTFGDGFKKAVHSLFDAFLPVFEVAYHGFLLYNPTSPTINYPIKQPVDRLTFFMRGGRPSLYLYSRFRTGGEANWMGEDDLVIDDERSMKASVEAVAKSLREYAPLADKQLVYMERYDVLGNGLECATYEDGSKMVGNFSSEEREFEGRKIPAYEFIVL